MNISIFHNMTSKQPSVGSLDGIANLMRNDQKLAAFTQSYRQTGNKTFKSECPLFAVACRFEGGKGKENIKGLTGLSLVDFDHIVPHTDEKFKSHTDINIRSHTDSTDHTDTATMHTNSPISSEGAKSVRSVRSVCQGDMDAVRSVCKNTPESLAEMKAKIIADPHTLMCYTTISGNGLRVIFKYELPPTDVFKLHTDKKFKSHTDSTDFTDVDLYICENITSAKTDEKSVRSVRSVCQKDMDAVSTYYQQAFYAGNAYYEKLLGMKADMQCKNLTRLSGLAHDPEVFLRPESEVVPFTAEEITTASAAYAQQSKEDKQMQRIQTYFDTLIAPQLAKANIVFQSGSHNEYVMRVGYRLAERRFSKKVAIRWAVRQFGADYPDTEQVINSCYANASPHGNSGGGSGGGRGDTKTASVEEIKSFLDGHVSLRFNEITSRVEYLSHTDERFKSHTDINIRSHTDSTDHTDTATMHTNSPISSEGAKSVRSVRSVCQGDCENITPAKVDEKSVKSVRSVCKKETPVWIPVNDRIINSLWSQMSAITRVNIQDMYRVIESDYVPIFNPFTEYLNALEKRSHAEDNFMPHTDLTNFTDAAPHIHENIPPVTTDAKSVSSVRSVCQEKDYIRELAATVRVKGGEQEQMLWYRYLRKWLVAMVASWLSDDVVNNVILVLIGEQGAYKTTWFNYLLPPELKQYFYTKTNANRMSKDDLLTLAQYALVCCEELDTMRPAELNQLKATVTMPSIDERAAYAHYHEHRKHIASFCGTGNNTQFLSDPTGNRRWLPFEVESIVSPRDHPFHYEGIYSQALALYQSGFQYWFTKEEIQELNRHNRQFETPRLEHELVDLYFRKPTDSELGEFMSVARALQIISNGISQKLSAVNVGRAFSDLGFKRVRTCSSRGFIVVCRTAEEIKAYQHRLSADAQPDTADDLPC